MGLPKDVVKLIQIYREAQENLVKIISEKAAKGRVTDYQANLLAQVNKELEKLNKQAQEWVNEAIPSNYQKGIEQVGAALETTGIDVPDVSFAKLHKDAIELIAKNTFNDLIDANSFVGREIRDALRQAGLDAIGQKLAQGQTVLQCKKNLIDAIIDQGINAIKDSRGRYISLSSYAETVARSTTREATNRATLNQLTELGYDLVKISSHASSCPLCAPLEGRVYSISGKDPRYPKLDIAYSGEYANIHPNCRHVLMPYIEEFAVDSEGDRTFSNRPFDIDERAQKQIDKYNEVQKWKRQMKDDRDQWQRYQLAMPDKTPKTFAGFRRMKNSNSGNYQQLESGYRSLRMGGTG